MLQLCGVDAASRHTTGCAGCARLTTDRTFRVAAQSRDGVVDAAPGLEAHRRLHWCQPCLCAQCWRAPACLSPQSRVESHTARGARASTFWPRPEPALSIWLRWAVKTMCVLPHALDRWPSALAHVRTVCHTSTQRCCCICLLLHPRVPTVCCAGRFHDFRRCCLLAANSVGFKQIKTCINTYKMHPAARLAYLREYANGNPYK